MLSVNAGDVIVWTNRDAAMHTATAHDGSWSSPGLRQGASWQLLVSESSPGNYYCDFHPGMQGRIN